MAGYYPLFLQGLISNVILFLKRSKPGFHRPALNRTTISIDLVILLDSLLSCSIVKYLLLWGNETKSLQRDKESPGGFILEPSENSSSYGTQEG